MNKVAKRLNTFVDLAFDDEGNRISENIIPTPSKKACRWCEFKNTAIGLGMWLGLIMAFNVWFIIWPNQKKVLGIVEATPEEKPVAAKKALIASRTNTLLSLPMLLSMVAAQNLY